MAVEVDDLRLVNRQRKRRLDIIEAIVEPPALELTIDGASTLELTVADHQRKLLRDPMLQERSWAKVVGIHFEFVALGKSGDYLTLTFEDGIVAQLRRHTKPLSAPANTTTRAQFAIRLCKEAGVPYRIDTRRREKVHNPLHRSADGEKSNSWDVLGSEVAEPVNLRRFSDGSHLVLGGDDWLAESYKKPVTLRENTGGVGAIDIDADVAKRAMTATMQIDTRLLKIRPGAPFKLDGMGPGDGLWIASKITQQAGVARGALELTRKTHVLKEPPREGGGSGGSDAGESGYVPGRESTDSGGSATGARGRMVDVALAQRGKPYVWGASGPNSFDCSGLVQYATAAAGRTLPKPSGNQIAAINAAGKGMSVDAAIRTRGAILYRPGHIVISLGNGSTIEAMGSAYGVCVGSAHGRGWTAGGWWI